MKPYTAHIWTTDQPDEPSHQFNFNSIARALHVTRNELAKRQHYALSYSGHGTPDSDDYTLLIHDLEHPEMPVAKIVRNQQTKKARGTHPRATRQERLL